MVWRVWFLRHRLFMFSLILIHIIRLLNQLNQWLLLLFRRLRHKSIRNSYIFYLLRRGIYRISFLLLLGLCRNRIFRLLIIKYRYHYLNRRFKLLGDRWILHLCFWMSLKLTYQLIIIIFRLGLCRLILINVILCNLHMNVRKRMMCG